jgi:pyruvate-formate lyase-activating enzyme
VAAVEVAAVMDEAAVVNEAAAVDETAVDVTAMSNIPYHARWCMVPSAPPKRALKRLDDGLDGRVA